MSLTNLLPPALVHVLHLDLLGSLILSGVLGAVIGLERSLSGKVAGPRTHMLIALGSALLTDISVKAAAASGADPLRIPAQIVSGLGFLGAGAIIQDRGRITGLTTAAGIWVASAVGIATAMGYRVEAIGATTFVLLALTVGGRVEHRLLVRLGRLDPDLTGAGEHATPAEAAEAAEAAPDDHLAARVAPGLPGARRPGPPRRTRPAAIPGD